MPLPVGTIVRARSDEDDYIKNVYGQTEDLVIAEVFPTRFPGGYVIYKLLRLDGSDPTQKPFANVCYDTDVVDDTFMHSVRQAIKEHDKCPKPSKS